jgi:hypothetical protein
MPLERPVLDSVFTEPMVFAGALSGWATRAAQQTIVCKILLRAQTGAQESVCLALPPRTVQQGMRRLLGFQIGVTTSIAIVTSSQVIR